MNVLIGTLRGNIYTYDLLGSLSQTIHFQLAPYMGYLSQHPTSYYLNDDFYNIFIPREPFFSHTMLCVAFVAKNKSIPASQEKMVNFKCCIWLSRSSIFG